MSATECAGKQHKSQASQSWDAAHSALYVALWIFLSGALILFNKWILSYSNFGFPITLTMWHMAFSSVLATALVHLGAISTPTLQRDTFITAIVPIGALFAGTLWLGNAAFLYLSVSFIQIIKAASPVIMFLVGCALGTEHFSLRMLANMGVVALGIAIASYGEIDFVLAGFLFQMASAITECVRLALVQILLQRKGLALNPISTIYYLAPVSLGFLSIPWALLEVKRLLLDSAANINLPLLLASGVVAFALNISIFLLIGKTSALTLNVSGVMKDWMLMALSAVLFKAPITQLNILGYSLAFAGVSWYNWARMRQKAAKAAPAAAPSKPEA